MNLSVVLSVFASLITLCVFVYYNYDILRAKTKTRPNLMTWLLWLGVTLINSLTYVSMNVDPIKGLAIFTDCFCIIFTTIVILSKKQLRGELVWQSVWEKWSASIGVLSLVAWGVLRSSTVGNQVLQFAYVMAFAPMYLGLLKDPKRERPAVWFGYALGFALAFIAAAVRWQGHWQNLVSPALYVLLHAITGWLASRKVNGLKTSLT